MTDLTSALASRIHDTAWVAWGSYTGANMSHSVDLERQREGAHRERISPSKPPVGCRLTASCICPCRMHSVLSFSAQGIEVSKYLLT